MSEDEDSSDEEDVPTSFLKECASQTEEIMSPAATTTEIEMQTLDSLNDTLTSPALVVHNEALFSRSDFKGLANVGQGSKSGKTDSIGRFGLGALSFYHFCEVSIWTRGGFRLSSILICNHL